MRKALLPLFVFASTFCVAHSQDRVVLNSSHDITEIKIRLLNGKTGAAFTGKQIFFDRIARLLSHVEDKDIVTGADGVAIAVVPNAGYVVDPVVVDLHMCSKGDKKDEGGDHVSRFPIAQILASGLVAKNTCGKITRAAQPGELILWARPKSVLEKLTD